MYAVELFPEFDCVTCTAQQKVSRGCESDSPEQYAIVVEGVAHKRCPRRPILDDPLFYSEVFWVYNQKKLGFLVEDGGLDDQAYKLMQCFRIIDGTLGKCQKYKDEQESRKRRRAAKSHNSPTRGYGKPRR